MSNNKYEVSPHRIDQLQNLLKNEAGLPSFSSSSSSSSTNNNKNNDNSFDSYLKDVISGSDTSAPCESCSGQLLRGSHSIICVYCGRLQRNHSIPNAISFNSTLAFQWLLHSLRLDPSETIVIHVGDTQSGNRGRGSIKEDEVSLSDFLDLQLKWGDHSTGFGLKDEEQLPGKKHLSLIGVDIVEILSQESVDHGSSVTNEHMVRNLENEDADFRVLGERKHSLFENAQPSGAAMKLSEGGNDESFAEWAAEFQFASVLDPGHEKSVNISSFNDPSGSTLNMSSSHSWSTAASSVQPFEFKRSEENMSNDSSFEGLRADEQHRAKNDTTIDERKDDDDDDEWGDFRMSKTDAGNLDETLTTAGPATDTSDGLGISDSYNDLSKDIQAQMDTFTVPDNAWNDLIIPSSGGDIPSLNSETGLGLLDGAFLEKQGVHVESSQNKISDQSDSDRFWGNEVHLNSIVEQIPCKESMPPVGEGFTKVDDSFDLWNDFSGSDNQQAISSEVANCKISAKGGNVYDAWNDFSGLSMEKKEEQADWLEEVGVNVNGNQSESSGLWNDNSFDEWNDFTSSTDVSNNKSIANDDSLGTWNDFSSLMVAHEKTASNSTRKYEDQAVPKDDNLFNSWNDFGSSGLQTGDSSVGPNDTKTGSDPISFPISSNSLKNTGDNNTIDSWGPFGGATFMLEQQLQAPGPATSDVTSGDGDFFSGVGNFGKQSSSQSDSQLNVFDGKLMEDNNDLFAWGDFTTSSNAETNLDRSVHAPTPDDKEAVKHGDLLASWNGIVSSPNVQVGKDTHSEICSEIGDFPDSNLSSPNIDFQYAGTISSMAMDIPISIFSSQNVTAPVASTPAGVSDLVKMEHDDVKGGYNEGKNISESSSKEALDSKASIAETLISEMHDLSFMLESSLSIPNNGI